MSIMIDNLQKFGLSEKEAKVYAAALSLDKATVDQLAKAASIVRTTTYTLVESLMEKGLMSSLNVGKKTYYTAESPSNLERLLERQKQQIESNSALLSSLLPDLNAEYNKGNKKPNVRYFSGKEGVVTMRNEVLNMKGEELLVATSYDDFKKVFPEKSERNNFTIKRHKRGIETKMLFTTSETIEPDQFAPEHFRRVDEKEFPFEFDVYIYDNSVAFSSLKEEIWGVIIESPAVAKSMKTMFNMAWEFNK